MPNQLFFSFYDIAIIFIFVVGYAFITIEHFTKINKATIALLMAVGCWSLTFLDQNIPSENKQAFLIEHVSDTSQVIFFLLGAMTIVEIISSHNGFAVITNFIQVTSKRRLLWIVGFIAFFLSSVIDNLTTTIVMVTLMRKLLDRQEDKLLFGGLIVIAANAGGAWTPIGDVTTTMLWIGGQISSLKTMQTLFLPSLACLLVPLLWFTFTFPKDEKVLVKPAEKIDSMSYLIFFLGLGLLIFVPVFKMLTGLPPFMAILFGLGVLWVLTDFLYRGQEAKADMSVANVLARIDHPTILFFLGILLCVNALAASNILERFAYGLSQLFNTPEMVAVAIGFISAIIDNVPLVAGAMGMYDLSAFPTDSVFWQLVAYCAGTGGSMLIIGSAAGVAFMGMEKVDFFWYVKRISFPALLGYVAGIVVFFMLN